MGEEDQKKQWQYPLNCDGKREPQQSYDILLARIQNPTETLKNIAKDLDIDYKKARNYSHTYFIPQRLEQYFKDTAMYVQPLMQKRIVEALTTTPREQELEEKLRTRHLEKTLEYQEEDNPQYLNYYKHHNETKESNAKTTQLLARAVHDMKSDNTSGNEKTQAMDTFINALALNRDKHGNE